MARKTDKYAERLLNAVSANDVGSLWKLLSKGAQPDTCYGDKYSLNAKTILHIACGKGYTKCVKALLKAGAMPDIHDKWGLMPLHYCLCSEFLDTATVLLDHVGNRAAEIVNCKQGNAHRSCLSTVANQGSIEGMRLLLPYGADVNDIDHCGRTPLMLCLLSRNYSSEQLMSAMKLLVEAGADLEIKNNQGLTALQMAARRMDAEATAYLLSVGADVRSVDAQGRSTLKNMLRIAMSLLWKEEEDSKVMGLMQMLIRAGANLNSTTAEDSVLMTCIRSGPRRGKFLRFFLTEGADPNICVGGVTPLQKTIESDNETDTAILLEYNASTKTGGGAAMNTALKNGMVHYVFMLLRCGDQAWRDLAKSEEILELAARKKETLIDPEIVQHIQQRLSGPPPLSDLCLYKLRSTLGTRLHKAVSQLPVPPKVKDTILMKHVALICKVCV